MKYFSLLLVFFLSSQSAISERLNGSEFTAIKRAVLENPFLSEKCFLAAAGPLPAQGEIGVDISLSQFGFVKEKTDKFLITFVTVRSSQEDEVIENKTITRVHVDLDRKKILKLTSENLNLIEVNLGDLIEPDFQRTYVNVYDEQECIQL